MGRPDRSPQPSDKVLELRGMLRHLRTLLRDLDDEPMVEVVGVGRELWRLIDECNAAMDQVKGIVRREVDPTPGRHEIPGRDRAVCVVTVPEPHPVMRNGTTIDTLREALGSNTFGALFTVKTTMKPRKGFADQVPGLQPAAQQTAVGAVDMVTGKPRVSFDKR